MRGASVDAPQADAVKNGPCEDVPKPGSRFSDDELAARFGVPVRGGVRISHESKCIVIVDCTCGEDGEDLYVSQDHRGGKGTDRVMDGDNQDPALSRAQGYTVLHFAREGGLLVFDSAAECDSIRFERRGEHNAIILMMRRGEGVEEVDYGRLHPEVERALRDMESGAPGGKAYTPDEYIEYIKKVMG